MRKRSFLVLEVPKSHPDFAFANRREYGVWRVLYKILLYLMPVLLRQEGLSGKIFALRTIEPLTPI